LNQAASAADAPHGPCHPETNRYFMTIPEAASLVLKAGGVGKSGHLYLLDMGEPLRIKDLAEHIIRFYGFEPERDIPIVYIGMRKGEKLHERLSAPDETVLPTEFPKINKLILNRRLSAELPALLEELEPICWFDPGRPELYRNRRVLRRTLARRLPTLETPDDEPEF
jgi:FlaA1/EpsC-like NDP-sugar epimerase